MRVRQARARSEGVHDVAGRGLASSAGEGWSEAVTEFHIVGGLHPELTLDWFCEMLRGLKQRFPAGAPEGVHDGGDRVSGARARRSRFARRWSGCATPGMDSLPGGGAEIFNERVRRIICDHKIDGNEWIETARMAHQLGLRSNCTMLYGHIENDEDRVDHLVRLRELQDETGGFVTFIPLAFHPDNTPLQHIPKTTGFDDIKNIAVARLMLDNIPHIKAYWVMMTPRIAQIALRFGADDLDGTIVEERIYHDAGATTAQGLRRGGAAAADPQGGPGAGRARHAVPAGAADGIDVYRAGVARAESVSPEPVRT